MVRPRLVEEGVPIGSTLTHQTENLDQQHDVSSQQSHRLNSEAKGLPSVNVSLADQAYHQESTHPQSSLLRAAGDGLNYARIASSSAPRAMHRTHFVIGEESMDHSMEDNEECESMISSDDHIYHRTSYNALHGHPNPHSTSNNGFNFTVPADAHPSVQKAATTSFSSLDQQATLTSIDDPHHHQRISGPPLPSMLTATTGTRTHYEIGADERITDKMEGVEDHGRKEPLIVLDGANVAYAYAHALQELSRPDQTHSGTPYRLEPNVRGIRVATDYFASHFRVLVVLPQSYYRRRQPQRQTHNSGTYMSMFVHHHDQEQMQILEELQRQGKLVAAPPADDDDAYALSIARRENARAMLRRGSTDGIIGPAFVLSNDLFRDAQQRDPPGNLQQWLVHGLSPEFGPGRISFAFCDLGRIDDHGDPELDIVPNPRHPLVIWLEAHHHQGQGVTLG